MRIIACIEHTEVLKKSSPTWMRKRRSPKPRGCRLTEGRRSGGYWTNRVSNDGLKAALPVVRLQRRLSTLSECPDSVVTTLIRGIRAWIDAPRGVSE